MSETTENVGGDSPASNRRRMLLEITDVVSRAPSLPEAFKKFAAPLLDLTQGEFLNLSLHDPRRNCMLSQYWKNNRENSELEAFRVDEDASGWAWKHQQQLTIPDTEREQRFPSWVATLLNHGVRSYTAIPMSTTSVHFGAVGLGRRTAETLNGDDLELLSEVARIGAIALEMERARRVFEEQQSLLAMGRQLSRSLELDTLLPAILSGMRSIARYARSVLALLDEEGKHVYLYGDPLESGPFVSRGTTVPVEQSLAGRAIQSRNVGFFAEGELRQMNAPLPKAMCAIGIRSACSVPVIVGDRVWGALNASSVIENAFGPDEVEYLENVATQIAISLHQAHSHREIVDLKSRLALEKRSLRQEARGNQRMGDIVGKSPALMRVLDYAAIVADTDSTVLITGETGTGKERIARVIHSMSQRKERAFLKLNCAAIPTGLLESELFGHEKGAFTGAVSQKIGRLELADKGTLLLDEVGEISLELQPKLLRVLQDQEFERLGGTRTIRVDVRLIAATNRNLAQAVAEKEFRDDLFYRLRVFPLHVPALRDRREDIPLLVSHFLEKCTARLNKRIDIVPDDVLDAMMHWSWPGNIRELENFIERSVILSDGNRLNAPLGELHEAASHQPSGNNVTLRDRERGHIVDILRQTRGALSGPAGAAARLGLKRTTLQYKMQRLGIARTDYLQ